MLEVLIEPLELYDESTGMFRKMAGEARKVRLEHSLVSVSKWEAIHAKPFLTKKQKPVEEILSYVRCMALDDDVAPELFDQLTSSQLKEIMSYIESPQSATTFGNMPRRTGPEETITSELVYYWLIAFSIPFECQNWHLNRLFSLIKICNIKNSKPQKMSKSELAARNRELNAQRRRELGTTG